MKSDFYQSFRQHLHCSAGVTCKAGLMATWHVLACPTMSGVGREVALAGGEGGSRVWAGLHGSSQPDFTGAACSRLTQRRGSSGHAGGRRAPGPPTLPTSPHPLLPLGHVQGRTQMGCDRKDLKAAKQLFCNPFQVVIYFFLYKGPKHLRSFRENRADCSIHIPLW